MLIAGVHRISKLRPRQPRNLPIRDLQSTRDPMTRNDRKMGLLQGHRGTSLMRNRPTPKTTIGA